jgi:hypothetical protein
MTRRRQAGFTLVEVLVAPMVFVIGILSIAAMMPTGSPKRESLRRSDARLEPPPPARNASLSTSYTDATLTPGTHFDPANPYDGKYYVSWSVQDNQPMVQCKRATVDVRWPTSLSAPGASVVVVVPRSGG